MAASLLDGINTGLGIARTRAARQDSEAQRAAREAENLALNAYRNRQLNSIDEDRKNDNKRLQAAADLAKQQREDDAAFAQAVGQATQGQSYDEMPIDWQGPVMPGKSTSEAIAGALAKGKGASSKHVDALLRADEQRRSTAQREAAADSLDRYRQGRLDQQDERIDALANQGQKEEAFFEALGTKMAPPPPVGEGPEMPAKPYDRAMAETMAETKTLPRGMRVARGAAATDPSFTPRVVIQDGVRFAETAPGKFQQISGDGNLMKGARRVTRTDQLTGEKIVEYVPIEKPATPEEMDDLKAILAENKRKTAAREGKSGQMSIPLNPANAPKWTEGKLPNGKSYRIKQSE